MSEIVVNPGCHDILKTGECEFLGQYDWESSSSWLNLTEKENILGEHHDAGRGPVMRSTEGWYGQENFTFVSPSMSILRVFRTSVSPNVLS